MTAEPLTDALVETLACFEGDGEPLTTTDVADSLDLGRRSTYDRLERLVDSGRLETKKVGANARVWWRPPATATGSAGTGTGSAGTGTGTAVTAAGPDTPAADGSAVAESLVDDVLDTVEVGIFVLDDAFDVAWVNATTERYFGLDRERILGRDKRRLVEERIAPAVADTGTFAETVLATYDDNAETERFECQVTAGESREERWLEHRSKPIEAGEYAGGRVELYYDVTDRERTERAHREDREVLESTVDAVEEYAIFTLDTGGHVETWNAGAERIKGYETESILGEHVSTFYTAADRDAGVPERTLAEAAREGSIETEGWRVRADGSRFWATVTLTAIRDDDGALQGYAKVTRDMTERREYERKLRAEQDVTRKVLETAPAGIFVVDAGGDVVRTNDRIDAVFDLDGDTDSFTVGDVDVYDESGTFVPPDERPFRTVFETGESVTDWECQVELPSGERRWGTINVAPIPAGDGERGATGEGGADSSDAWGDGSVARAVVATQDVTRLKRQERQLERQRAELERELDEVYERVDDAFYALDEEFRFEYVNDRAAALLGHDATDLLGRHVWEALSVPEDDPIRERFERAMASQESTTFERDSEVLGIWEVVRVYPSPSGLSVYFTDVTERKERERELERYETVVEALWDGVYALDPDENFVMANDAFLAMTGYDRDELLGKPGKAVHGETINEAAAEAAERVDRGELEAATLEFDFETKGGETIRVESRFGPYPYDEERSGRTGVVRDVTERRERERELEESRRRYRTLVEHFPNGAVGLVDEDLRYRAVGGTPLEEVDATIDELEGTPVREALPAALADVLTPAYEAALDGEASTFEATVGDRTYQFRTVPVTDDDGEVFAALGMSQDVTERREYERHLEDAKSQLEAATEAGAIGTFEWHVPEDRMVTGPSFARTFGVDPEEAREGVSLDRFLDAIHEDDRERVEREIEAAVSSCGSYEAEYRVRDADSETRWVVARGHVECDEDGDPVTFPGAVTDITDRKETERELARHRNQLEALNTLNEVVRDITSAIVDQSTREEIEATVCERLAETDSYRFAWIGDVDARSGTVTLRTEAGVEGYLDGVTITVDPDDERSEGPTGRALRTGEIQVTQDVQADPRHDPWRDHVESHDVRSSAAIPIVHRDTTYGVLNVYADRPFAFADQERAVVRQLGEVVGHAIAAAERRRALLSDELVELEFGIEDFVAAAAGPDEPTVPAAPGDPITLDHVVEVADDEFLLFGSGPPEATEALTDMVDAFPHWAGVDVRETGDSVDFELRLVDPPVLSLVAARGGYVDGAVIEDGDLRMTIHLAPSVDVRQVIDAVEEAYPRVELHRRRQYSRPQDDPRRVQRHLAAELTDRQSAALEAAYHAGFFEWPRESDGEDVAGSLDVAPSTFHQHLRKAERKVFDELLSSTGGEPAA